MIQATSLATFMIVVGAAVFRMGMATALFLFVFWLVSTGTVSRRLTRRVFLARSRRRGRNGRGLVIAGTNDRALEFARNLVSRSELGYRIAGFVDQDWQGMERFRRSGHAVASDFGSFPQLLQTAVMDEVVIALPLLSMYDQASWIAALCEEEGIKVRRLTNGSDLNVAHSAAEDLEDDPLIAHSTSWVWPPPRYSGAR